MHRAWDVVWLFVGVLVLSTGFVITTGRDEASRAAEDDALGRADEIAFQLADTITDARQELSALVALGAVRPPADIVRSASSGKLGAVSWLVAEPGSLRVEIGRFSQEFAERAELEVAAVQARDRAETLVVVAGDPPRIVLLAPLYETAGALAATSVVPGTAGRRQTLAGFLAATVDLGSLEPVTDGAWRLATSGLLVASAGEPDGERADRTIDLASRSWTVSSWARADVLSSGAVAALVGLALAGVAGLGLLVREKRERRKLTAEIESERARGAVVAELAPTLQRSLELSDVLPIVALQLVDGFALTGVSVVTSTDERAEEVFSFGLRPDDLPPSMALGSSLAAGDTAALALTRAGRLVAELRLRAGRQLDERDLQSIQAAAELATSAIVTAQALDRHRRAVDRLTELDAVKNVFLTTAAHELRTPVAAIKGFGGLLRDQWDVLSDDERRLTASRVAANADGLNALVQDLLDFSRLETGGLTVSPEPVDLGEFVRLTVDRLSAAWSKHAVEVDVTDGPPVVGDRLALERVLTNVLANAARYSPEDTTIRVSVSHDARHGSVIVDDEGPGVPPDERERIFDRFYRGNDAAVLSTRGVGIGLAVVREYVRQLGGAITVTDAPSGGARFVCDFVHHASAPQQPEARSEGVIR